MRKKILLGVFLMGILLVGIGTGIAFGEYSSFSYVGETVIGQDGASEVETLECSISLGEKKTRILDYAMHDDSCSLVEDKTLKDGQVRIEVVYNPDYVVPHIDYTRNDPSMYEDEYEYEDTYNGEICVYADRTMGEFEVFMKYKDKLLNDLKNKMIGSYYLDAIASVTVKANAKTLTYLEY